MGAMDVYPALSWTLSPVFPSYGSHLPTELLLCTRSVVQSNTKRCPQPSTLGAQCPTKLGLYRHTLPLH